MNIEIENKEEAMELWSENQQALMHCLQNADSDIMRGMAISEFQQRTNTLIMSLITLLPGDLE